MSVWDSLTSTKLTEEPTEPHVILEHCDWWMTGSTEEVGQLLVPCPPEELGAYPISRRVNNPRNEGPELRRPAA
jgi:putative SOS response-associated peptidase YedK